MSAASSLDHSPQTEKEGAEAVRNEEMTTTTNNNGEPSNTAATNTTLVPPLASHQITHQDLDTCCRVLHAVASLNRHSKPTYQSQRKRNKKKRPRDPTSNHEQDDAPKQEDQKDQNQNDDKDDEDDGLALYQTPVLRPLRKALAGCLELHKRTMFHGQEEEDHYRHRQELRSLKRQKVAEQALQQQYLAATQLRQGRVAKLRHLQTEAQDHEQAHFAAAAAALLIPDGPVETSVQNTTKAPLLLTEEPQTAQQTPVESDDTHEPQDSTTNTTTNTTTSTPPPRLLPKLRSCYVCKVRYRELHSFYDQLCPSCAALNWHKRHQTADLHGKIAVVTGARVKIGFHVCLKLLRAGAHVVATTRFPHAAVAAYRKECDFETFYHRLQVVGLDLRDVTGLEALTRFLTHKFPTGIDMVINNACQTVRRPVAYYTPLVQQEQALFQQADAVHHSVLNACRELEQVRQDLLQHEQQQEQPSNGGPATIRMTTPQLTSSSSSSSSSHATTSPKRPAMLASSTTLSESDPPTDTTTNQNNPPMLEEAESTTTTVVVPSKSVSKNKNGSLSTTNSRTHFETTGLSHSAAMSQLVLLPEDAGVSNDILAAPVGSGVTDINGHALDLRTRNSWTSKLQQVSTPEVVECMFVNAIAPFVLNARLQPLLTTPPNKDDRPNRYIINVSAMEGKFYRYKMPNHPHTNMAKAALNMMTRTSAEDLAVHHKIYMNSVDTGWINDENPLAKAKKTAETNLFQTPIDEVDAAARILDPIFVAVLAEQQPQQQPAESNETQEVPPTPLYGKFLKDYHETEW